MEGGIPPLVALLESTDCKVQRQQLVHCEHWPLRTRQTKISFWSQAGCFGGVVWLAGYVAITRPEEKSFNGRNLKVLV
jgi:hypothetical protein